MNGKTFFHFLKMIQLTKLSIKFDVRRVSDMKHHVSHKIQKKKNIRTQFSKLNLAEVHYRDNDKDSFWERYKMKINLTSAELVVSK